jgi:hypothetical protein
MIVLQIVWCCRMTKAGVIAAGVMSTLTTVFSTFAGVWAIVQWKDSRYCHVFTLTDDDNYNRDYYYGDDYYYYYADYCNEVAWAVVAFIQA